MDKTHIEVEKKANDNQPVAPAKSPPRWLAVKWMYIFPLMHMCIQSFGSIFQL